MFITTTLPYVNSKLHIGHALEFVQADVIARWMRSQGIDVFFNVGTDEHGLKILQKANLKMSLIL
ncbi:MAG TPA: class I tRNA ligase family protein [Candidatus Absconditabacterales bacterium]|nr:class I tRNA ligase family protein [Candidatus Absconditabacterales bacterium]